MLFSAILLLLVVDFQLARRLDKNKREIWLKCKELLLLFDSDYTENDDFCVAINVINSSEDHFVKSHKDFQDISFQYAFACGKYSGGQTCVLSTYGKRHWDIDYKYCIYRMKEIEKLVSKLKERNQARTKKGINVFNTQLYLMMR